MKGVVLWGGHNIIMGDDSTLLIRVVLPGAGRDSKFDFSKFRK
jgi:hypothetical protein